MHLIELETPGQSCSTDDRTVVSVSERNKAINHIQHRALADQTFVPAGEEQVPRMSGQLCLSAKQAAVFPAFRSVPRISGRVCLPAKTGSAFTRVSVKRNRTLESASGPQPVVMDFRQESPLEILPLSFL